MQPKTNPLVSRINPLQCDSQPGDRTETGPMQMARLGHILDQDWTGESGTRITGPTMSQDTSASAEGMTRNEGETLQFS